MKLRQNQVSDFLIIGGGVIGISVARPLSKMYPNSHISLLEKENNLYMHTSGRNSGVLHAGFYYSSQSLKATFCREGNKQLTNYCEQYNLPIRKCGKLVVPKNESEIQYLNDLYEQGLKNKVQLHLITPKEAREIDPYVRGYEGSNFIWSPSTAVVDSTQVLQHLAKTTQDLNHNFKIYKNTKYINKEINNHKIITNQGIFPYKYLINAAGQQSITIAQEFGFGNNYDFLPMKGNYVISDRPLDNIYKTLVYPVPIKGAHFLGIHTTLTIGGFMKVGPTVSPAFSIENYKYFENIKLKQLARIFKNYGKLLMSDQRNLIWNYITQEMPNHSINKIINDVQKIHSIDKKNFKDYYKPGIRAQLINKQTMKMENDFILEHGHDQMHILNIVSPGFTCSLPMGEYIVKLMSEKIVK